MKNFGKKTRMKKLFNFRPILFIAISLCCGISTAYFFMRNFTVWGIIFISFFALSILVYLTLFTRRTQIKVNAIFALVFVGFFVFGNISLTTSLNDYVNADLGGHYYNIIGRVKSVNETDVGTKLVIENVQIKGNVSGNLRYNVAINVYGASDFDIGDRITFDEYLLDKHYVYEDDFNASDVERKIKYSASVYVGDIMVIGNETTVFEKINLFIRDTLKAGLDKDEFTVAHAMLTGEDGYMDYELLGSYRIAGIAHIFAVSGLHIGFLATALSFLFKKLRVKGYVKAVIITFVLLFYSGVCGYSASSIRATVMTAVMLFATAKGQRYDGLSAIALAAILILLVEPIQLLCVGFQLSFAVVLGINLLSRPIAKLFKFLPSKIANSLGVVFSAQIVAIPISLATFGYFSWISILANLIFIPIVSVIFILTLVMTLFGGLFSIAHITLFVPNYIFKLINFFISFFDSDIFIIEGLILGGGILVYYIAVIFVGGIANLKVRFRTVCSLVLVFICAVTATVYSVQDAYSVKLYVSGSENVSATLIKSGVDSTLVVSDVNYIYSTGRLKRIAVAENLDKINNLVFMGGYSVDMQVFITKLRTAFDVENVYYYGERDELAENIVKKSFSDINIKNFYDGQKLPINTFSCVFSLDGNVLVGEILGKSTAIFSAFNKSFSSVDFKQKFDIMICYDGAESIISRYKPQMGVSYRSSLSVLNGETNGNLLVKIT